MWDFGLKKPAEAVLETSDIVFKIEEVDELKEEVSNANALLTAAFAALTVAMFTI